MKIFHNNEAKQLNILDERFYQSDKDPDKYYPSVTTILEVFPKGYGYDEWLRSVGFNSSEILRKAGEQGSNIHAMIDQYLGGTMIKWVNEDESMRYTLIEWQMFSKFVEFWTKWKPETYVHEFSLVSDKLGFGGTIDFIGKIGKHIYLIDWRAVMLFIRHTSFRLPLMLRCGKRSILSIRLIRLLSYGLTQGREARIRQERKYRDKGGN